MLFINNLRLNYKKTNNSINTITNKKTLTSINKSVHLYTQKSARYTQETTNKIVPLFISAIIQNITKPDLRIVEINMFVSM